MISILLKLNKLIQICATKKYKDEHQICATKCMNLRMQNAKFYTWQSVFSLGKNLFIVITFKIKV